MQLDSWSKPQRQTKKQKQQKQKQQQLRTNRRHIKLQSNMCKNIVIELNNSLESEEREKQNIATIY